MISLQKKKYLSQKLVNESDIADFVEKRDFDGKLKNVHNKITLNKSKNVLAENKF